MAHGVYMQDSAIQNSCSIDPQPTMLASVLFTDEKTFTVQWTHRKNP